MVSIPLIRMLKGFIRSLIVLSCFDLGVVAFLRRRCQGREYTGTLGVYASTKGRLEALMIAVIAVRQSDKSLKRPSLYLSDT